MTKLILKHLLNNENYCIKVFPFLKGDYFETHDEQYLFKIIQKYQEKYSSFPNIQEVQVLLSKNPDEESKLRQEKLLEKVLIEPDLPDGKFLLDETEEYIRNKDLQLNIIKSVELIQKGDKNSTTLIPGLIEDSLAISFDKTIGIDYNSTAQERIEYYKQSLETGFKTDLEIFNRLTNGGFKRKTLTTIVAQPHLGKSLMMTHLATSFIAHGYDVLYVTLEMDEREIAKRIDSNLLSIDINEFHSINTEDFIDTCKNIMSHGIGKLIVKEFPTGGANCIHIRSLIKELKQKLKFKADIILVDYLGIMAAASDNMYENIKKNAEGLRGISIEEDCCVITASQTNRGGFDKNNGISMADVAESTGPLQISDLVIGMSKFESGIDEQETEDVGFAKLMERMILINVLKNRMGGLTADKFLLKQNFRYMRMEEENTSVYNKPITETKNKGASSVLEEMSLGKKTSKVENDFEFN